MRASAPAALREADIAVVGAGAAGLYAALCAARDGASVALVSAAPLAQTASYWAQGGLAAALAILLLTMPDASEIGAWVRVFDPAASAAIAITSTSASDSEPCSQSRRTQSNPA